jgi:threonine/homoserine/homoserine lactone efflux protein
MSLELWLAYVLASAVLLVIPGPTILTVISYSLAQGPARKAAAGGGGGARRFDGAGPCRCWGWVRC